MAQTALDWFLSRINKTSYDKVNELIEQAKQMEKEQIIKAFGVGCQVESTRLIGYHDMAEQYYKETYNK